MVWHMVWLCVKAVTNSQRGSRFDPDPRSVYASVSTEADWRLEGMYEVEWQFASATFHAKNTYRQKHWRITYGWLLEHGVHELWIRRAATFSFHSPVLQLHTFGLGNKPEAIQIVVLLGWFDVVLPLHLLLLIVGIFVQRHLDDVVLAGDSFHRAGT